MKKLRDVKNLMFYEGQNEQTKNITRKFQKLVDDIRFFIPDEGDLVDQYYQKLWEAKNSIVLAMGIDSKYEIIIEGTLYVVSFNVATKERLQLLYDKPIDKISTTNTIDDRVIYLSPNEPTHIYVTFLNDESPN